MPGKKNLELSKGVLSTLAYVDSAFYRVADRLNPDMWIGEPKFGELARAIWHVKEKKGSVSLSALLPSCPSWKASDLRQLQEYVDPKNIELLAEEFYTQYRNEQEIEIATNLINRIMEGVDYSEAMAEAEQMRQSVIFNLPTDKAATITEALKAVEAAHSNDGAIVGIETGDAELDKLLGGWQKSRYTILAARPSMGKTTVAIQWAVEAALAGHSVLFFTLEDDDSGIYKKAACYIAGVDYERVSNGGLKEQEFARFFDAMDKISNLPLHVEGGVSDISDILNIARAQKHKHGAALMILDYIQLVSIREKGDLRTEVTKISRKLKIASGKRDLDIPIIALSQLSRAVEQTSDKRPKMHHLRESGAIEQDADAIFMLYRPEYYGITMDEEGNSLEGVAEIICEKNKHGRRGVTMKRYFQYPYTHYSNEPFANRGLNGTPEPVTIPAGIRGNPEDDLPF